MTPLLLAAPPAPLLLPARVEPRPAKTVIGVWRAGPAWGRKPVTRTEYLGTLVKQLRRPEHGPLAIEFKPFTGWLLSGEQRAISDDGCDFAGRDWREAEKFIRWFLA